MTARSAYRLLFAFALLIIASTVVKAGGVFKYDRVFPTSYGGSGFYSGYAAQPVGYSTYYGGSYYPAPVYTGYRGGMWPFSSSPMGSCGSCVSGYMPPCSPCGVCSPCGISGCSTGACGAGGCATGACGVPQTQLRPTPATEEQAPAGVNENESVPVPRTYEEPVPRATPKSDRPDEPPFDGDSNFRPAQPKPETPTTPQPDDDFPGLGDDFGTGKTDAFRPPLTAEPESAEDALETKKPAPIDAPDSGAGGPVTGDEPGTGELKEGDSVPVPEFDPPADGAEPKANQPEPASLEAPSARTSTPAIRLSVYRRPLRTRLSIRQASDARRADVNSDWLPNPAATIPEAQVARTSH